jgi:integrase
VPQMMAGAQMARLTKQKIEAAISAATSESRLWDDDPKGLGLRIKANGTASFFIQFASPVTFKKARHTVGQYGRLTINQARTEAKRLYEVVANGRDPAIEKRQAKQNADTAATMAVFCDDYMRDARAGLVTYRGQPKKPSTISIDQGRVDRHIKPLLGKKLVRDITKRDIEKAMHDIRLGKTAVNVKTGHRGRAIVTGGAGTATRTVRLMGSIFSYAIKLGVRLDNPAKGVEVLADGKSDRVLSPNEYRKLGEALDNSEAGGANLVAINACRLLALTGCRRSEVFSLLKTEVDDHAQCLRLGDTKTGQQVRVVGRAAMDLLDSLEQEAEGRYVFPASKGEGHLTDAKLFRRVCADAGLKGVSLHTLRHSFATVALELEFSELTIAGLLGHRSNSITSRYAHHVDRALVAAADRVSALIARRMDGIEESGAVVVSIGSKK